MIVEKQISKLKISILYQQLFLRIQNVNVKKTFC